MALVKAEDVSAGFGGMSNLGALRQIGLLIGLAASIAVGVSLATWSWAPNYGVLYGGLEEQDVSNVLDALRQSGIDAKLDDTTGAILVPSAKIHDARIKLASLGLPKGISAGFDALDEKSSFGVSQFMEKARYQRALEVELARTVMSLSSVKNARVHLAVPRQTVFVRNRKKSRASVVVNLFRGRSLEPGQVAAIVHMVSSSVPNLEVGQVTIVDQKGSLLTAGAGNRELAMTNTQFEYTRKLEKNYAERIENILEPILGSESVRAQVTADVDFTVTEQTQESFNPDAPALRSNQTTTDQSTGSIAGGVPGALSNQPPGAATAPEVAGGEAGGVEGAPSSNHRREINNYELDKTISHTRRAMGRLHRLSVAVVVDDSINMDSDGNVIRIPRTPEELSRLTNLVKDAVGFNAQRGDTVNMLNSAFSLPTKPAPLPVVPIWEQAWAQDILKKVLGALLVLALFFGVLRPVMRSLATQHKMLAPPPRSEDAALAEDMLSLGGGGGAVPAIGGPGTFDQNMVTASKAVEQDPKLVAQVVKNWVATDG